MGKHEPMTAKAIANRIKAKGLQKTIYYCQMCEKQCRDANGFKCHVKSESHIRQALVVGEDLGRFVNEYSKQFMESFMFILRTRYRTKRILANTVYQEYIKERDHVHLNATEWHSLSEFANWLGEKGIVKVDDSERGPMVTYIDRDPETLRRQELEAKRAQKAQEAAERNRREIELEIESRKKLLDGEEAEKPAPQPIPLIKVPIELGHGPIAEHVSEEGTSTGEISESQPTNSEINTVIERPLFNVHSIQLKPSTTSSYKPQPKKKKVKKATLKP